MKALYVPRVDSVAARCIAFFQANPDEELTLEDITDKFDAIRGNIHTLLAPARDAGLLGRYQNDEGEYIYKAGPKIGRAADLAHIVQRRRSPVPTVDLPDPLDVAIEDDVPIPASRTKRDWMPLLKRLKVKQSASLPLAAQHMLSVAITQAHKDQLGTFTTRRNTENQTIRVWRTA